MSQPTDRVTAMRTSFRDHYANAARFREDGALAEELTREAEPVLDVLHTAFAPSEGPRALHEGYALLNLLARRAATLGATPAVALTLAQAIVAGLRSVDVPVERSLEDDLGVVAVEGYSAARDELVTRELRESAARHQVAVPLGPRCVGIFLAGRHEESDLAPTLDGLARDLLRADAQSCLLDLSRLAPIDEELARALGRLCAHATTLGICTVVYGADAALRAQFARWSLTGATTQFVDDYELAQTRVLTAAGLVMGPRRRWTRLFFPARGALMR
jgi:hypothetical protein